MSKITIINYDIGNLLSVERALQFLGADYEHARQPEEIIRGGKFILPGVGAFASCMNELKKRDLIGAVQEIITKGLPLLGICVGMQMLFDSSEEFGHHEGLGNIPGNIQAIPKTDMNGITHRIPHIAWSALQSPRDHTQGWDCPLLTGIKPGAEVYYVHSYTAHPQKPAHRVADSEYGGQRISGIVHKDNVFGVQFHPEKSGPVGLKILENYIRI